MSWLFIPETFLACAPESEVSSSESCSPSLVGERLAAASATSRGKHLLPQAWSRRWKQGGFIRLLSGPTYSPSTLDLGAALFISSLRATPVRTTRSQDSESEPRAIASSLPRSSVSPTSAGLILSSARTCRGTQASSLRPSSRHWSEWATALRQEYSARPKPEIPCGASDCSSWPSEWMAPVADDTGTRTKRYGQGGMALSMQATSWPSPDTMNHRDGSSLRQITIEAAEHGASRGVSLHHAAETVWAAPQARDHFPPHSPERIAAMKAEGHGMRNLNDEAATWRAPSDISKRGGSQPAELLAWAAPRTSDTNGAGKHGDGGIDLRTQVDQWATPMASDDERKATQASHQNMLCQQVKGVTSSLLSSCPDQATQDGPTSSSTIQNCSPPSVKRKLNCYFVEGLMRWPTGLSGFERPEMAWTQWWQLMLSYVSALVSPKPEAAQGSLF